MKTILRWTALALSLFALLLVLDYTILHLRAEAMLADPVPVAVPVEAAPSMDADVEGEMRVAVSNEAVRADDLRPAPTPGTRVSLVEIPGLIAAEVAALRVRLHNRFVAKAAAHAAP